jgi:hypothetical protein
MTALRLAPVVIVQIGTLIEDGTPVPKEGDPINGQVPLSKLTGCAFYEELMAKLPELEAQLIASQGESAIEKSDAA